MNKYKKLIGNTFVLSIANFATKILTFLILPIYTYVLSAEEYGSIDTIITVISLLLPLVSLSVFEATLKYSLTYREKEEKILTNSFFILGIGILMLIGMFPIFYHVDIFKKYIAYIYIILLLQGIYQIMVSYFRGIDKIPIVAAAGVIQTASLLISNVFLVFICRYGIKGYLLSVINSYIITLIFFLIVFKEKRMFQFKLLEKELSLEMLKYSIPLIPNSIMWWIIAFSDKYVILAFLGLSANGIYAMANKVPTVIGMIQGIFVQAWQISALEESNSADKNKYYSKVFNLYATLLFMLTMGILVVLKPILINVFSIEYKNVWKYCPLLLFASVFSCFSSFYGTNYLAMNKTKSAFISSGLAALVNIIFNFILIPRFGINGAGFATLLSYLVLWRIRILNTREFVEIKINYKYFCFNIFIILLLMFMLYFENIYQIWILIFIFIIGIIGNVFYCRETIKAE